MTSPDIGDLIPWTTEYPKLREQDISGLTEEDCETWLSRLTSERASILAALEEHARRCRIRGLLPDDRWKSKVCLINKRCGALMALIHTHRGMLKRARIREERSSFAEAFIQAAYAVLSVDQLDAVLTHAEELAPQIFKPRRPLQELLVHHHFRPHDIECESLPKGKQNALKQASYAAKRTRRAKFSGS